MQFDPKKIEAIDGWLHPKEGRVLFDLARQCTGRGVIVEIGSWKGKSTICLAGGSRAGSGIKVHAIDPHTGSPQHLEMFGNTIWTFEEFKQNIQRAGMTDLVEPHVDFSESVAKTFNQPVELIFVDGLHEYEGVKGDFDAWFPKVVDGGSMVFHDATSWEGVLRVMEEDVFLSRHFRKCRFTHSVVYAQKVASNTALERAGNRVMLTAFKIHAWIGRKMWRLLHHHLDSKFTRAAIAFLKGRKPTPTSPPAPVSNLGGNPS